MRARTAFRWLRRQTLKCFSGGGGVRRVRGRCPACCKAGRDENRRATRIATSTAAPARPIGRRSVAFHWRKMCFEVIDVDQTGLACGERFAHLDRLRSWFGRRSRPARRCAACRLGGLRWGDWVESRPKFIEYFMFCRCEEIASPCCKVLDECDLLHFLVQNS